MATITDFRKDLAAEAAHKANELGGSIHFFGKALMWIISLGSIAAMIAVVMVNSESSYSYSYTNWSVIWPMWGAIVGAWIIYALILMLVMAFGSITQVQAQALEIQIIQAKGD